MRGIKKQRTVHRLFWKANYIIRKENRLGEFSCVYTYDAFGNVGIKTPNETAGEAFAAMLILITNPLSYRGYLYAPMAGYSYYLGSRFYAPALCRFMNADVYADTAQGVVGTNMFAYCNNNPIMFKDPFGTAATTDQPLGFFESMLTALSLMIVFFTTAYILSSTEVLRLNEQIVAGIEELITSLQQIITVSLSDIEEQLIEVKDILLEKIATLKRKPSYKTNTEIHHICAKKALNANKAKKTLIAVGCTSESPINLISLYSVVHKRIHTYKYYDAVNKIVIYAHASGNTYDEKRANVKHVLEDIRNFLTDINTAVGRTGLV